MAAEELRASPARDLQFLNFERRFDRRGAREAPNSSLFVSDPPRKKMRVSRKKD
jgi:hypothetical protein